MNRDPIPDTPRFVDQLELVLRDRVEQRASQSKSVMRSPRIAVTAAAVALVLMAVVIVSHRPDDRIETSPGPRPSAAEAPDDPSRTGTTSSSQPTTRPDAENTPTDGSGACMPTGRQTERTVISAFFAAYNSGDEDEANRLAAPDELWDPVGAPYTGTLRPDLGEWMAAGQDVHGEFEIVELCVYPGRGADGEVIRRNDQMERAGIVELRQGFKVRMTAGTIEHLVLYMPVGETKQTFCSNFGDTLRQIEGGSDQC